MRKSDEHTTVTINRLANSCAHTVTIVFLSETNPNAKGGAIIIYASLQHATEMIVARRENGNACHAS